MPASAIADVSPSLFKTRHHFFHNEAKAAVMQVNDRFAISFNEAILDVVDKKTRFGPSQPLKEGAPLKY